MEQKPHRRMLMIIAWLLVLATVMSAGTKAYLVGQRYVESTERAKHDGDWDGRSN